MNTKRNIDNKRIDNIEEIRLNKFISEAGICSRREADRLIENGRVLVDGRTASPGEKVTENQEILVDGKAIHKKTDKILLLFHKPRGIVCTTEVRKGQTNIDQFLKYPDRVTYIGRLDKESEGLLLLTNYGDIINKIMRSGNYHEKEYEVTVDHELKEEHIKGMMKGVPILNTVTRPCTIKRTGSCSFNIILTQGLNRQIRRMCEYYGYQVKKLKRIRIMHFHLDNLKEGEYRKATAEEWNQLEKAIQYSSKTTVITQGGSNGKRNHTGNERTVRKTASGGKSVLSGRQRNHQ